MKIDKYALYERAVQSPEHHAHWFNEVYKELRGREPRRLCEDFCGTFRICCEWVKLGPDHQAYGLDLDLEPLAYGKTRHLPRLSSEQQRRVKVFRRDVTKRSRPIADLIAACNFSFFVFQRRAELLTYFRACRSGLAPGGLLVLEMAGGPGMIEPARERTSYRAGPTPAFTYVWEQRSFDPITRRAHYLIHFLLKSGRRLKAAFQYDWRMWTIPEVRDALIDAGFRKTRVYWESTHKGVGTGEYLDSATADNAHAWIAYVVAEK